MKEVSHTKQTYTIVALGSLILDQGCSRRKEVYDRLAL